MYCVYVIERRVGVYKIGIHTGGIKKLMQRYITYYPKFILIDHISFDSKQQMIDAENKVKQKFSKHREKNLSLIHI